MSVSMVTSLTWIVYTVPPLSEFHDIASSLTEKDFDFPAPFQCQYSITYARQTSRRYVRVRRIREITKITLDTPKLSDFLNKVLGLHSPVANKPYGFCGR